LLIFAGYGTDIFKGIILVPGKFSDPKPFNFLDFISFLCGLSFDSAKIGNI